MSAARPIPDGYHSVTPYLYLERAAEAIDFYKNAFGAEEAYRMPGPDGTIGHAEIRLGDSIIMLADNPLGSPATLGGRSSSFLIYLEDVDQAFARAIAAGGIVVRPVEDKFYGDRSGTLLDPFGQEWSLATHVEDVSPEEMERRMAAAP
jgi:PhnB protein